MDKHANDVDFSHQIRAWIWEAAIKLDFQDICQRIKNFCDLDNLLKVYFQWGKENEVLVYISKIQEIISELQNSLKIGITALEFLQSSSQNLLSNPILNKEKLFVDYLLFIHHCASILIFAERRQDRESLSASPLSVFRSNWSQVKESFGFQDDSYKNEFIRMSQQSKDCKNAILKKKLSRKDRLKCFQELVSKLKDCHCEIIKRLQPPILVHFCNPSTRSELKLLNSPLHTPILKHIKGDTITSECLASLLDELQQFSPRSSMKRKASKLGMRMGYQKKKPLLPMSSGKNGSPNSEKFDLAPEESSIIVVHKNVAWILRNVDELDVDHREPLVQSRSIVRKPGREAMRIISPKERQSDDVFEISLGPCYDEPCEGVDPIAKLSQDIEKMEELIKTTKRLITELQDRYENLKVRRDHLRSKAGRDYQILLTRGGGDNDALTNDEEGRVHTATSNGFHDSLQQEMSLNSSRSISRSPSSACDGVLNGDSHFPGESDCEMDNFKEALASCNNSISMPELVPHNEDESQQVDASPRSIPNLTPNLNSSQRNPIIRLTPLKKSTLNKFCVSGSSASPCLDNERRKRRWRKSSSSDAVDSVNKESSSSCSEGKKSCLSKIDLRVTELHSSQGNDVVILESDKSSNYHHKAPESVLPSPSAFAESNRRKKTKSKNSPHSDSSPSPSKTKIISNSKKKKVKKGNKQKEKKSQKKTPRRSLIITSTLWNRKIFSSTSNSSSSQSDHFSSGSEEPKEKLVNVSQITKSQIESPTKDLGKISSSSQSSSSSVEFYTPEQTPRLSNASLRKVFDAPSPTIAAEDPPPSDSSETIVQNSQKSQKTKNCEVNLTLKRIHMKNTGIIDVYS